MKGVGKMDPAFMRGMTQRRLSRRQLLQYAGAGAGALSLSTILAACGSGTAQQDVPAAGNAFDGEPAGTLEFANWPLYMDQEKVGGQIVHPSLDLFTKETDIAVNYHEVIQDNFVFFGKIQPQMAAGESIGYDLMVLTNTPVFSKMVKLGYLLPLDHSLVPNFTKNANPAVKDPPYDPGNQFTVAWQSGFTGIAYNPKLTGREITSFQDLFDPAFAGKVGMLGDTLDLPNFALVGMGVNPESSTPDDWQAAADLLTRQRDDGIVRQYYNQNYINALSRGDVALTMGWSGDIFQTNLGGDADGLQFVIPDEGGILWTDNMMIPAHAEHPVDAITYMDFVYRPDVAAMMTEWINYISPVPGATKVIEKDVAAADSAADKEYLQNVLESPMVFPPQDILDRTYAYRVLDETEEQDWNALFQPIYQG